MSRIDMSNPVVLRCNEAERQQWAPLAQRLDLQLLDESQPVPDGVRQVLQATEAGLSLAAAAGQAGGPGATRVDFHEPALLYRLRTSGKRQGLGQALGLLKHPAATVLDATAGLGRDALLMAYLGCHVVMLERSGLIHALLEDGLRRAAARDDAPQVSDALARMSLQHAEARQWLQAVARGERSAPDMVYLDPMFPPRQKSAKVKKDMALLQDLLGAEDDFAALLQLARAAARVRVVVKRPGGKSEAGLPKPTFTVPGKSAQFDVYESSSVSSMR